MRKVSRTEPLNGNGRESVSFASRRTSEFATVPSVAVFYDSWERKRVGGKKSGFCGRAPAARNACGPSTSSFPVFIKIPRAPGKKRNIRATQSVSPVPYVVLRPLLLWLLIPTFSPAFAFSPPRVLSPWPLALLYSCPFYLFRSLILSCIARGGTYSEDRRGGGGGGGGLEKDSVAHPPMSFGRFKPYFGIEPPRGVDGSGRIRAFMDFTTFENHSRAAFTAVKQSYATS